MSGMSGDEDKPPPYEPTVEPNPQTNSSQTGFDKSYLMSLTGALKLVEIVLSFIGFIAAVVGGFGGGGFVLWVCISAFITATVIFVLYGFRIYSRLPGFWPLYMFIYHILYTLKYLVAAVIAAIGAGLSASVMTTCVICFIATLIYLLDTVMSYRAYQAEKLAEQRRIEAGEGTGRGRSSQSFCIIF